MTLTPSSIIRVFINFWQLNWVLCWWKWPAVWNRAVLFHRRYALTSLCWPFGAFEHRRRQKRTQCRIVFPLSLFTHYQPIWLETYIPLCQFLTPTTFLHLLLCCLLINLKRLFETLQRRHVYTFLITLILWVSYRSISIADIIVAQVFDWADGIGEHGFGFGFWVATWGEGLYLGFGGVIFGGVLLYCLGGWGKDALLFF